MFLYVHRPLMRHLSSVKWRLKSLRLFARLFALVARSKTASTIKKYAGYWNRFVTWTTDRKFSSLPATETTVGLAEIYINICIFIYLYIAEIAEKFCSVSVANAHINAIIPVG